MGGTRKGGLKAAATNKKRYGEDFYRVQGAKGGKHTNHTFLREHRMFAQEIGAAGGRASRRRPTARGLKARADAGKIHERIGAGESVKAIAKEYGLSDTTIRLIAKRGVK